MRRTNWTARRKLMASLAVLGFVLVVAAVAQFTGKDTRANPYASTARSTPPRTSAEPSGRAVFGAGDNAHDEARDDVRPSPTGESPLAGRTAPVVAEKEETSTRARSTDADTGGIDRLLARWRDTVAKGDVDGNTELYAPRVDRFFRERNVSQASVRKTKSQMMSLYPTVNKYEISDVKVEKNDGREAVVSFRKEWDMKGQKPFSGAERQRLTLRRIGGDWKIVGEEETKVYWVKRS
jgi:hypothetical protein